MDKIKLEYIRYVCNIIIKAKVIKHKIRAAFIYNDKIYLNLLCTYKKSK